MSNDEQLADKLTSLLHTALRVHQSNADVANATSFKRLAGLSQLLTCWVCVLLRQNASLAVIVSC